MQETNQEVVLPIKKVEQQTITIQFDAHEVDALSAFAFENILTGISILLNLGYKLHFPDSEMMILNHDMKKYSSRLEVLRAVREQLDEAEAAQEQKEEREQDVNISYL